MCGSAGASSRRAWPFPQCARVYREGWILRPLPRLRVPRPSSPPTGLETNPLGNLSPGAPSLFTVSDVTRCTLRFAARDLTVPRACFVAQPAGRAAEWRVRFGVHTHTMSQIISAAVAPPQHRLCGVAAPRRFPPSVFVRSWGPCERRPGRPSKSRYRCHLCFMLAALCSHFVALCLLNLVLAVIDAGDSHQQQDGYCLRKTEVVNE